MRYTCLLLLSLSVMLPVTAVAQPLVRFNEGIGATPAAVAGGAVLIVNTTRGVPPGGRPWVIGRLRADVMVDGRISVDGRGLLLAGGDGIGTTANQSVRARLFCGPAATATVHQTDLVLLEANGDFRIDGELSPVAPTTVAVPDPCTTPVLLIVSGGGSWFAAGILK